MASGTAAKCHFHIERNGHCIQHLADARSEFPEDFIDKVPALLAPESREPPLTPIFADHNRHFGQQNQGEA